MATKEGAPQGAPSQSGGARAPAGLRDGGNPSASDAPDYGNLKPHPLAKLFPKFSAAELAALVEDIRVNGLHNKITLFEGKILDGVNRYAALKAIGFLSDDPYYDKWGSPLFQDFDGGDIDLSGATGERIYPLAFVISANLNRRQLTDDQRAAIAAKIATMKRGGDRSKPPIGGLVSIADAADKMKVPMRTVERAKAVENADPELLDQVADGEIKLAEATKKVKDKKPAVKEITPAEKREIVKLPLKQTIATLIAQYGYDAVADEVMEHTL
jgi:hypothetical protein